MRDPAFGIALIAARRVLEFAGYLPGVEKEFVIDAAIKLLDALRYYDKAQDKRVRAA